MKPTEFENFIAKTHPDPDNMIHVMNGVEGEAVKVYYESEQIVKLAEKYAEQKVIEYRKEQMIKKGLNST